MTFPRKSAKTFYIIYYYILRRCLLGHRFSSTSAKKIIYKTKTKRKEVSYVKRFLSLLLAMTMLASMFTAFAAFAMDGTIVFYNAADNSIATQLDGVDSLYANVTFTANKTGTASVMAAHYDVETGNLLKMELINSVTTTAGVVADYNTPAISVADTDVLKVFAWDAETLAPLTNAGIIERDLLEELPTATVTAIKADADFALNFVADEVTDEQLAFYGDWEADFVFTANKAATFNANGSKDGYLVGQYDEFGPEFVKIPATDLTVSAGAPVSIMEAAGLTVTYRDVVETVKDFDCGVDYSDAYLKANNGLEVSIALVLVNPENGNTYTVAEKAFDFNMPTATVTDIKVAEADFALNFKADEVTESQVATFGDWAADYVVTLSKDATFNANGEKDGYLLGQYDEFGAEWVKIPAADLAITAGAPVKVLETAGMSATYRDVVETVKDFDCGIKFAESFLKANDGVSATVELRIYNPLNPAESYVIGDSITRTWKKPTATVTELDVEAIKDVDLTFALNFKADESTQEQLLMFGDWYADYELTVNKTATFNANGGADGFLSGQYDAWSKNWVSVPFEDATLEANTPVRVMETAAALMGQSGLKLTYADVYNSVKDFNCGLAFTPEFLVANPDLEVTLALKMYNPKNENESYVVGQVYTFTPETIPSIDKFIGKDVTYTHTLETVEANTVTYDFADLFTVIDGVPVKMEDITVTGATYKDGKITVEGFGEKVITVTDNYYCNEATATVTVNEPANIDKFTGNTVTYTHTLDTIEGNTVTFDFAELFTNNGYDVKDITVTGATYADGKVTVEGLGTFTITATDNFYCNEATATVVVNAPDAVDKWSGKAITLTHTLDTIEGGKVTAALTDLFEAIGPVIMSQDVVVTVEGATVNKVASDWTQTTVDFTTPGEYTVTITDNYYCNIATATVTVNEPANVDKFVGKDIEVTHTLDTIESNVYTVNFADLFDTNGYAVKDITVTGATYADGKVTVEGLGTITVTATDNFYCNVATATVTVNEPANVDKFVGKDIEVTHTLDTIESNVYTVDFADLFDTNGYAVKDITVTGGTYADGKVTVEGLGTITVTATDNFYCNVATATITVNEPANVDKWTATNKTIDLTVNTVGVAQTVDFAELFTAVEGAIIKTAEVTVDGGIYADGVITVPGVAGTYTVTVTDNFYCNTATATITVNDAANVDKFVGKAVTYTHTLDTIEANTVTYNFADLFDTNTEYVVKDITVTGATYADGKITVTGIGTFTITATDNFYCNEATATVTVKEPANVDKWTGKTVSKKLAYGENTVTATLDELFTNNGYTTKAAVVGGDGVYENGVVTFTGAGTYTVTITDNFYCNTATATVIVAKADSINKFTAKNPTVQHTLATMDAKAIDVKLGDIFSGTNVVTGNITVTIAGKATTVTAADWANATVTIPGTTGDVTVTINDNYYCNTATGKVILTAPANVTKWTATNKTIDLTVNTVGQNQTFNFADLFTAVNGAYIKSATVTVNNGGSFADGVITVPGKAGTYTVTVTDNFYCNATTATITVNDAANVDKFTGKTVTYTHTLDTIDSNSVTYNFADLFTTNSAYPVKTITVTGGTYANGKITITGTGTKTITATDNYYCNTATATVTIKAPANVTKWTAKSGLAYETDAGVAVTKTLGELFSANGNKIKDANVSVTGATSFTKGATWDKGTVTFNGAGTYTVTITDGFYCTATSATVTVAEKAPAFGWAGVEQHPDANGAINPIEGVSSALAVGTSAQTITVNAPYTGVYLINVNTTASAATTLTVENQTEHYATFDVAAGSNKWALSGTNYKYILLIKGENTLTVTAGANATLNNVTLVALKGQGIGGANGQYTDYRSQLTYNTFECAATTRISNNHNTSALGAGKSITYTVDIPEGYYAIRWTNGMVNAANNTTLEVTADTGFYRELINSQNGWTQGTASDGKIAGIYFRGGSTTVTITNTGSKPVGVYEFRFYPTSSDYFVDMDCVHIAIDSTIPEGNVGGGTVTPTPTPTPTPDVGSEPTAPAELTGASFASAIINPTNMNVGSEKAEFGYKKSASMTVKMGVPANGTYQLSAQFSSNANYVSNSEITKVFVDGVEVTSFPQSNKVNPNWSPASDTIQLTKGDHEITLTITTSWNLLYIHGLKLEAK